MVFVSAPSLSLAAGITFLSNATPMARAWQPSWRRHSHLIVSRLSKAMPGAWLFSRPLGLPYLVSITQVPSIRRTFIPEESNAKLANEITNDTPNRKAHCLPSSTCQHSLEAWIIRTGLSWFFRLRSFESSSRVSFSFPDAHSGAYRRYDRCLVSKRYARRADGRTKDRIDLAAALWFRSIWHNILHSGVDVSTILSGVLHIGKQSQPWDGYQVKRRVFFFLRLGCLALVFQRHFTRNNIISIDLLTPHGHHPISSIPAGYVLEFAWGASWHVPVKVCSYLKVYSRLCYYLHLVDRAECFFLYPCWREVGRMELTVHIDNERLPESELFGLPYWYWYGIDIPFSMTFGII